MSSDLLTGARAATLRKRIRIIVALTIAYNVAEAIIAIAAGAAASSSALIGFGLDSVVEVASAAFVAWQFTAPDPKRRERITLKLIAGAFFALALVVSVDASLSLIAGDAPEHSNVGIVLAAASLAIMPTVAWFEKRTGRELGSATAVADARQLIICSYLSAALLVGLGLNSLFGWWWADPLAAIVIAGFAVREGLEAWRGDGCCATSGALLHADPQEAEQACCDPHENPRHRVDLHEDDPATEQHDCCATSPGQVTHASAPRATDGAGDVRR